MATMQELIEQWKKEAAQSQTVTGKDIPWVGMYQAQNDEHRAYDTNSALETAQQNQAFLDNLNAQTQAMNNEAHKIQTDRAAIQTVRDLGNLDVRVNGDLGVYDNAWKTLQAQRANIDMNRLAELSDIFTKAEAEHGAIPFSYKSTHWENPYLSLSDADKQIIQNYIQANKDRTDLTDNEKKTLQAFARAYTRAGEQGINTANVGNNTRSDLANKVNSFAGGFASFNQPLVNFLAKGVNKLPILNQISDDQIASGQIQANQMLKNAQEQNPKAYEAGRGAGQIYDYLITSALTNGALDKLGLGTKGAFAANQALQLAQDLGLDILPEAQKMQKEEGEINWGKLLYKTVADAGLNLAMGIAPTLAGTSYDYLTKTVGNNADIFKNMSQSGKLLENAADISKAARDTLQAENALADVEKSTEDAFTEGIRKRADELAAMNAEGYKPPTGRHTAEEIAGLNTNPVEANNSQFNALMNEFNGQFKDTSAMRNVYNPEDLNASLNNQLRQAMDDYRIPEMENPKVEMELPVIEQNMPSNNEIKGLNDELSNMWGNSPKSAEQAVETAQNVKNNYGRIELPEDVAEKGASDFQEIYDSLENMRKVAEASGDEKVLAKFDKLSKSVNDYENAFFKNESEDALISAKKATDAARQSFIREVKKTNPNYTGELTGTKLGNAAYRRTSMKADEQATQEFVDSIIETEKELGENNRWVRDAVPETQNPLRGVEVDTTGPRPYAKNQSVSPSVENAAESLSKEMDNAAKTQQPRNFEIKELHDKKGRSRYQVVERISENMTQPVEAGKTYKTIDEANEAVYRFKNSDNVPGANPLQTFAEGEAKEQWKTSKARTNTFEKQGWGENMPEKDYAYRVHTEAEQNAEALQRYKNSPDVANDLMSKDYGDFDEVDVKAAMNEIESLMNGDKTAIKKANRLGRKLSSAQRQGGRIVQATAEYNRNTPLGQMRFAQNAIDDIVDKKRGVGTSESLDGLMDKLDEAFTKAGGNREAFAKEAEKILNANLRQYASGKTAQKMTPKVIKGKDTIMKMIRSGADIDQIADVVYKQNGGVKLTAEENKQIYDYLVQAYKEADGSQAQEQLLARAAKIATGRAPSTLGQKFRSVLYTNMLGNFKTAVSRNAFGNAAYQTLEQGRQPIAAALDSLVSLGTGKRSTLGWNKAKAGAYLSGFKKGAAEQISDMTKGIDTGRSGAKGWEQALANNATTFNDSKAVGKFANSVEYYVRNAMELGDRPFYEANYQQAYTELQQMVDRFGKDNVAGLEGIAEKDLPTVMDMIASVRAADSVFQKHGKMSKGLTNIRNGLGQMSEGIIGADVLSTAASPFTMTPGNMLERAIEYSPIGAGKNAVETGRELLNGNFNQRRFVDEASRTLTGLPVLGAAYYGAKNGLINGGYSKDADEKKAQQEDGYIEYGLNVPESVPVLGGKSLDSSDLPVYGPFMQAGAAINEQGLTPESALQAAEAIVNGSTMQGFNRVFGASNSYSSGDSFTDNLLNTVMSSGTQLVPSLVRQTAQTADQYKRDLGEYNTPEYFLNNIKNSIPGLRETLPIKTDVEGQPILQNQGRDLGSKILENYVLPMNVSEYEPSTLNQEASRLLEATDSAIGFVPGAARKDLRQWDEQAGKEYTEEQFRTYKEDFGKLNSAVGNALLESDFYKGLSDEDKAKALQSVYSGMKQVAKENATGIGTDDKVAAAYRENGEQGVIDYLAGKKILKDSGLSASSNAGKAIKEAAAKGDLEAAQKAADEGVAAKAEKAAKAEAKAEEEKAKKESGEDLSSYGFTKPGPSATYQKAKGEIPGLTTQQFASTYKAIDSDGNQGIRQTELLDYLNNYVTSDTEAQKIWSAYGGWKNKNGETKKLVKKNGKWTATY